MRAFKELSTEALLHNVSEIQQTIPNTTKIMGVIKANAYGTDSIKIATILEENGMDFFAVATIDEGIALRKSGIEGKILILGYTTPERAQELANYQLIQTIISKEHAHSLNKKEIKLTCHLKIDTGMHRLGVEPSMQEILPIYKYPFLKIQGMYSHLGSADDLSAEGQQRTRKQIALYNKVIQELTLNNIEIGITHLQSSYGILNYPELTYDYVRPGIILYGLLSKAMDWTNIQLNLQPVIRVKAVLVSKKNLSEGEYVGYGIETKLTNPKTIGVISIGYADGVSRNLADGNFCLNFEGKSIPQIGRICMDMMLVDLTEVPEIPLEAMIDVFPNMEAVANHQGTITNELMSCLGSRLETRLS